jgi:hypothetical protein
VSEVLFVRDKYLGILAGLLKVEASRLEIQVARDWGYPENLTPAWQTIGEIVVPGDPENDKPPVYRDFLLGAYRLTMDGITIASWKLYQMPHCCGIVVSCNATVDKVYQNRGIGTVLNQLRQDIGRSLGFSLMMCTDIDSNQYQRKLLKTNGWRDLYDFVNRRTKNRVIISCINL